MYKKQIKQLIISLFFIFISNCLLNQNFVYRRTKNFTIVGICKIRNINKQYGKNCYAYIITVVYKLTCGYY